MKKRMTFTKEQQEEMKLAIQEYLSLELDLAIGELGASLFADYLVKELGYMFYNKGIEDAIYYMKEKTEDLYGLQLMKGSQ